MMIYDNADDSLQFVTNANEALRVILLKIAN